MSLARARVMSLATRAIADSNADVVSPVVESKNASRFPRAAEPNAHTTRANSSALISPASRARASHIVRHASAGSTHPHRVSVAPRSRARRATAPGSRVWRRRRRSVEHRDESRVGDETLAEGDALGVFGEGRGGGRERDAGVIGSIPRRGGGRRRPRGAEMRDAVGDEGRLGDGERGAGAMEVAVARLERVEDVPGESQVALEFLAGGEPVAGPRGRVSRDSRIVARVGLFLPGRRARAGVWGPDVGEDGRCAGAGGARAKGDRFQAAGGCPRSGRRASRLPRRRRHPSTQRRDGTASAPAKHGDAEGVRRSNRGREPRARSPSMRPTRSDLGSLVQSCGAMPSDGACCPRRGCALLCPEVPKSTHLDDLPSSVIPALGPRPCSLRRVNPTVAAAKETSDMDHMNHMNHMNHGGGLRGHDASDGGGMGHSMKGMPVAFEWGHRVTLFFDGWATETSFDYVLALFGLFLLCVAQEQLYHFRTSLRMSRQEEQPGDLSAPIVPKPFRYVPHSRVLQLLNPSSPCPPAPTRLIAASRASGNERSARSCTV